MLIFSCALWHGGRGGEARPLRWRRHQSIGSSQAPVHMASRLSRWRAYWNRLLSTCRGVWSQSGQTRALAAWQRRTSGGSSRQRSGRMQLRRNDHRRTDSWPTALWCSLRRHRRHPCRRSARDARPHSSDCFCGWAVSARIGRPMLMQARRVSQADGGAGHASSPVSRPGFRRRAPTAFDC
jgi:hypothetical protein